MRKVLVSGGLGFVGYHLVNELLKSGHFVEIVDNKRTNVIDENYFANLFPEQVKVTIGDIKDYKVNSAFDQFYHLASIVGPAGILPFARILGYEELVNAKRAAEICLESGARLLFISTSEVYGPVKTCEESIACIIPSKHTVRLVYGLGKLVTEHFLLNQIQMTDLKCNIVRPFNIVGEFQASEAGFVLPRFFESALNGKDITVFHSGEQLRTFTYVKDIVFGMTTVMNSKIEAEVFNVANPNNLTSILDLARKIKNMCNSDSKIVNVDPKTIYGNLYEEAYNKVAVISKIESMLGWHPVYSLEDIFFIMKNFYLGEKNEK